MQDSFSQKLSAVMYFTEMKLAPVLFQFRKANKNASISLQSISVIPVLLKEQKLSRCRTKRTGRIDFDDGDHSFYLQPVCGRVLRVRVLHCSGKGKSFQR